MIYEQRTYHALPGRMPDLLRRFEAVTLPIWARIGIRQTGFWTYAVGGSNHDLVYLLAWESMAEREQKWTAFSSDPEWLAKRRESEANGPLLSSFSNAFLQPTSFSAVPTALTPKTAESPRQVLERFYDAERAYMSAGSAGDFAATIGAVLAPDVVLHQSPDLPWGGEYVGWKRYAGLGGRYECCVQLGGCAGRPVLRGRQPSRCGLPPCDSCPVYGGRDGLPDGSGRDRSGRQDHRLPAFLLECPRLCGRRPALKTV